MNLSDFPTLDAYIAAQNPGGAAPAVGSNTSGNLFTSALKSGAYGALSDVSGAVAAGAKAVGYDTGATNAQANAVGYAQQAQAAGRSDIEGQSFFGNGVGGFAKKTAYEVTKQLPVLAASIAAAPLAPEIAEGSLAARAAGAIGSRIGSEEAGGVLARHILGGAAVTVPQAIGANYEAASEQPGGATQGDALKAIGLGLPVGLAQAVVPGNALGLKSGASLGQRLASSAFGNAAAGAVGAGLGTAATLSFDPTKSAGDKAQEIVGAALQGGAFGGLFGGAFGLLGGHGPTDAPSRATNADLASTVDAATGQRNGQGAGVGAPAAAADPRTPIEAQTLPQGQGGGLPPVSQPAALPESGLTSQLLRDRFGGEPQAPDQTSLLDRFLARPPEPGEVQGPAPLLALPKPLLRLTDQREAPEVPTVPGGPDIRLPDRSASGLDENYLPRYDAVRLPDRSDLALDQGAFQPEQRTLPVDTQALYVKRLEDIRQSRLQTEPQTGRAVVPYNDPTNTVEPWWRSSPDERVNASPTLGPEAAPNPHTQTPLDIDPASGEVRRFSRDELYDPAIGAPQGDTPRARLGAQDDAAALERDRARLKALFPDRGTTPAADAPPRSIAERVTDAAQDLTGGTGGEAKIADIRKALPDLAPADIDNALRQIHGDDSDNTLTQAAKGQRNGVDGVSLPGQGRFHNLSVEARDGSGVQERGAAPQAPGDRPGGVPADGGADPTRPDPARASADPGAAEGRAGATDVLPRPEPAAQVVKSPERTQVEDALRGASGNQAGQPIGLDNIRARLAGLSRTDVDKGLREILADPTSNVALLRQDDPKQISSELAKAAFNPYGEPFHVLIRRPDLPTASKASILARSKALAARNAESGTSPTRSKLGGVLESRVHSGERPRISLAPTTDFTAREATEARANSAKDENAANAVLQRSAPDPVKPKATWAEETNRTVLPRDQVQQAFDAVVGGIKAKYASKIHLVNDEDSLPIAVRRQAAIQGLDLNQVPGLYHKGEVYIRADQATSRADIEDVISHEVFGHLATEARVGELYGPDGTKGNFEASLADAFDRAGGVGGLEKIARELGVWDGDGRGGAGVGLRGYLPDDVTNLTTHQKSVLLDELIAHAAAATEIGPRQRALLEYVGKIKGVIADALRKAGLNDFAARLDRFDASDVAKWVADSREALSEPAPKGSIDLASLGDDRLRFIGGGPSRDLIKPKLIRAQEDETGGLLNVTGKLSDHFDAAGIKADALATNLDPIRSGYGIVRKYSDISAIGQHYAQAQVRSTIESRIGQLHSTINGPIGDFVRRYKEAGTIFNTLRQEATAFNLDPTRPWEEHTWLRDDARKDTLQAKHTELARSFDKLGQEIGSGRDKAPAGLGQQLYAQSNALQRGDNNARLASVLHNLADVYAPNEKLAGFEANPGVDFTNRNDAHSDPAAYEQFWKGELDKRVAGVEGYLQRAAKDDPALADIKRTIDSIKADVARADQGPYWHLGRQGDFFLSARIANDAEGPIAASVEAISAALDKGGYGDVALSTLGDNSNLFLRVGSRSELAGLRKVFDGLTDHLDPTKEVRQGDVNTGKGFAGGADLDTRDIPLLERYIARVKASYGDSSDPAAQRAIEAHINQARGFLLDTLPDHALSKVLQKREVVQGYSTNQLRNDVFRGQVSARAIAGLATGPETLKAAAGIQKAVTDAQLNPNTRETLRVRDGANAYLQRSAASQVRISNSFAQTATRLVHAFYIGVSPAYFIAQLSQLGTLTLPELGSRYGYVASTAALARNLPAAGRIIAEMVKQTGVGATDITPEVLAKANLTAAQRDLVQNLVNGGHVNLATFAHMGQVETVDRTAVGAVAHKALKFSNGTAVLSETIGRLTAALAAHDLHTSNPEKAGKFSTAPAYAAHVLSESMFNWGGYDTPRLFSQGGPLGAAGPVAFQFHQFSTKLFEKVLYEAHNGFVAQGTDAAASRKFIYGHAAVVTALAGALGLPAAGWTAAAINRLTGLFNDGEGYDVEAHARTWLAGMVGKDAEQILSRGLPRYLGADLSDLGDNSFLPFQRILEDHRSFKDAVTSYLASSAGSTPGVATNAISALNDIKNGKLTDGLAKILPAAILRNGVKAYQLSERGYVNGKGERMPLSVSAIDIIARAIGFESGKQAAEADRGETIENANEDRRTHAGVIKQQLAIAIERRDPEAQAKWLAAARSYDQDPSHRGEPLLPSFGGYLAARAHAVAYSRRTGLPLGTSPKDLPALNLANY